MSSRRGTEEPRPRGEQTHPRPPERQGQGRRGQEQGPDAGRDGVHPQGWEQPEGGDQGPGEAADSAQGIEPPGHRPTRSRSEASAPPPKVKATPMSRLGGANRTGAAVTRPRRGPRSARAAPSGAAHKGQEQGGPALREPAPEPGAPLMAPRQMPTRLPQTDTEPAERGRQHPAAGDLQRHQHRPGDGRSGGPRHSRRWPGPRRFPPDVWWFRGTPDFLVLAALRRCRA